MQACAHDDDGKCVEYLLTHKADPSIVDNKVSFIFFKLATFFYFAFTMAKRILNLKNKYLSPLFIRMT